MSCTGEQARLWSCFYKGSTISFCFSRLYPCSMFCQVIGALAYVYCTNMFPLATGLAVKQGLKGFDLLTQAAKPSETQVVHRSGHPSQYERIPLLLNFSEETDTHHTVPQIMKVWRQKMIPRSMSLARARA